MRAYRVESSGILGELGFRVQGLLRVWDVSFRPKRLASLAQVPQAGLRV